ncbi:peptide chain release factor N(5)-glutamine methyltransferase [Sodalis-like secondary symbiont of Drepanosiphum platanoidis]|uniref:peptide chain release factor N(5)-glutamine methyltransferase n=1 Tax=Sodalis-like secondary symbiont of Drepanosiphum platanoidis TaxID=2994493 RepID=UPI0034644A23
MVTISEWLFYAKNRLKYITNSPQKESEILLKKITGISQLHIIAFQEKKINYKQIKKLEKFLYRREIGEPLEYILKECEFWSLNLKVSNCTLIPRIESECLVEQCLYYLDNKKFLKILDLGTGTGAIALALASEQKTWNITGVDYILNAIYLAYKNSKRLKINNVKFIYSNWFSSLKNIKYNLIVSNPPYLSLNDFFLYKKFIYFEPISSLVSKKNGFQDIFFICKNSKKYLFNYGWLIIEHGWKQGKVVRKIFLYFNFKNIKTIYDYNHNERITVGQFII